MNIPPKNRTSVARNVHIPSVDASRCWGMSSNCSASADCALAMNQLLLRLRGVLVGRFVHNWNLREIMLRGRRGRLPLQAGRLPRIGRRLFAVLQRPYKVDQWE